MSFFCRLFQANLLINVIRSLTSTATDIQLELEKTKLEEGLCESEDLIHELAKGIEKSSIILALDHKGDIEECLEIYNDTNVMIAGGFFCL